MSGHCGEGFRMRVLITGGAGFIGSHMVDLLLEQSYEVRAIDNLSNGRSTNLNHHKSNANLTLETADLRDVEPNDPMFKGVDYVFHFAGIGDIVPSVDQPTRYMSANVMGTVHALEAARHAGVQKFVYAASSSCYGSDSETPTTEQATIDPQYPYALSKYMGEQAVLHWGQGEYGQAGDGGTSDAPTPHQIAALGSDNALVSGTGYTCLVLKADGALWAWGYNGHGQLADGTTTNRPTPAQISSVGTDNAFVTGGGDHVLLLKADGALMGWGWNRHGQLGNGNTDVQHSPVAISVPGAPVIQVSAGYEQSYATAADGTVYAWGYNGNNELGDGTTTNRHSPVAVSGLQADPAAQLLTGPTANHMLVLQPDGTAVGWGHNGYGQVGTAGTSDVQTAQDSTALGQGNAAIALGYAHTAVLKRP